MPNYQQGTPLWYSSEILTQEILDDMLHQKWGRALKKLRVLHTRNEETEFYNKYIEWATHYSAVSDDIVSGMCIEPGDEFIFGMEPPFCGIGDNIIFSLVPEAAKKAGWKSVYLIENHGLSDEQFDVIWGNRDDIDGISSKPKTNEKVWMWDIIQSVHSVKHNLGIIQRIIMGHGLYPWSVGKWPKIGYTPRIDIRTAGKVVIDVGSNSTGHRLGNIDPNRIEKILNEKGIFNYVLITPKEKKEGWGRIPIHEKNIIEANSLKEYCDLIFSAEHFITISNGGYWLAGAMRKNNYKFNRLEIIDTELGWPSWMTLPVETWSC
jgi:hypothetical protein